MRQMPPEDIFYTEKNNLRTDDGISVSAVVFCCSGCWHYVVNHKGEIVYWVQLRETRAILNATTVYNSIFWWTCGSTLSFETITLQSFSVKCLRQEHFASMSIPNVWTCGGGLDYYVLIPSCKAVWSWKAHRMHGRGDIQKLHIDSVFLSMWCARFSNHIPFDGNPPRTQRLTETMPNADNHFKLSDVKPLHD